MLPPWHVQKNAWRSAPYGTEAIVVCDPANTERLVTDDTLDLLERLTPVARRLGCEADLRGVEAIVTGGASNARQRKMARAHDGDLRAVVAGLVAELRRSAS